jgi:hypothetical protein
VIWILVEKGLIRRESWFEGDKIQNSVLDLHLALEMGIVQLPVNSSEVCAP